MRLVTCTNSAARVSLAGGRPDIVPAGPGGVVPMIAALMRQHGGDWVFVASGQQPSQSVTVNGVTTTLHPLSLEPVHAHQHHVQISIEVLQWLFHYLHDTSRTPWLGQATWTAWEGYCEVNRRVAQRAGELSSGGPDEVVLVNDHQLMLVPESLRADGLTSRLVYFHQLPWCQSDYFGLLPQRVRTRILHSLLTCDVVGFHARRWAEAFLQCCERFLSGLDIRGPHVVFRDRRVRIVVAPGPVDEAALARVRADRSTDRWRTELARAAAGRRMLVRAERFDLWKNVGRGLAAVERLLERQPHLAADLWHCALLSWPRRATDRHRRDRAECEAAAERINARFGRTGRETVRLLYPDGTDNTQHRVVAALEMSAATLVNPTFDGLNLVVMESLLLSAGTPAILSVNAGAYEVVGDRTVGIDPFDVEASADAIGQALAGTADPAPRRPDYPTMDPDSWLAALFVP
jgi:trehalose 6-phosphate synthase